MVTSEDAVKFKAYMGTDQYDFTRSKPTHPMYYDRDLGFQKDRSFWLVVCFALIGGIYIKARFIVERDRYHMWNRRENLSDMPAHHFHNRGGVLIRKQFDGFEKYHANNDELMHWYTKAFPDAFRKGGE